MTATARMQRWVAHPSTKAAVALVVVGLLFLLIEVMSPSRLYWTGRAIEGTNHDGIVFYTVDGEKYTVDDTTRPPPPHDLRVTVYVDPGDPTQALVQRPTRWVDAAAVLVWFVAAAGCLLVAGLRRSRRRGRLGAGHGHAQPETEWISHYVERSRRQRAP